MPHSTTQNMATNAAKSSSRIAFFGSPQFAVPILEALLSEFEIPVVVTQPPKPVGRHQTIAPTPVAALAAAKKIPVHSPAKLSDPVFRQSIDSVSVDLAVVAAYGKILPPWLLEWPSRGMINVHGSLLPAYRGASPITAAIADGLTETGITFIKMSEGMDEGDMLRKAQLPIGPDDTTGILTEKMSRLAAREVVPVVRDYLGGTIEPEPQPQSGISYTGQLHKNDGRIDLANPPANLDALIRAYDPWPGVWSEWRGKRIKLLPGGMVQLEGKRATPLADFRRGHPDFPNIII